MLTEGNARYNKAGINPALLWNKAVPNSTFRPEVDMSFANIRCWTAGTLLCVIRSLCSTSRRGWHKKVNEPLVNIMQHLCQYSKHFVNTMINIENMIIYMRNDIVYFSPTPSPISNTRNT